MVLNQSNLHIRQSFSELSDSLLSKTLYFITSFFVSGSMKLNFTVI